MGKGSRASQRFQIGRYYVDKYTVAKGLSSKSKTYKQKTISVNYRLIIVLDLSMLSANPNILIKASQTQTSLEEHSNTLPYSQCTQIT